MPIDDKIDVPKATFNQVVKSPATYYMLVAVCVMWFFVFRYGFANDKLGDNCEAEKKELRAENRELRTQKDNLTTALLIKNGVIDAIKTDTTTKKK